MQSNTTVVEVIRTNQRVLFSLYEIQCEKNASRVTLPQRDGRAWAISAEALDSASAINAALEARTRLQGRPYARNAAV